MYVRRSASSTPSIRRPVGVLGRERELIGVKCHEICSSLKAMLPQRLILVRPRATTNPQAGSGKSCKPPSIARHEVNRAVGLLQEHPVHSSGMSLAPDGCV